MSEWGISRSARSRACQSLIQNIGFVKHKQEVKIMTEAKKKQFTELKEMHPDTLLLFRYGDFYESYQEDAESASRILGITLTRDKEGDRQTMFPHYALDTYLPRLIRAGHRIAICDELKQGRAAK